MIILFDFDGCVITQRALEYTALILLRKKGYGWKNTSKMNLIDFARLFEESDSNSKYIAMRNLYKTYKTFIPNRVKRLLFFIEFSRYYQFYEPYYEELKPNLREILIKLKKCDVPLAIASNTGRERIEFFREKLGLDKYFDVYLSREDYPDWKKPHPYPIILALAKLKRKLGLGQINKSKVFYIGDLPSDIQSANAAGVNSIALLSGHGRKRDLEKQNPTYTIRDIADLQSLNPFKKFLLN